jgi:hypothetical protein
MTTAAVLFVLAALGGGAMAAIRLSGKPYPPLWLALGHGLIAVSGLAVFTYTALNQSLTTIAHVALGMFYLTAGGGFVMLLGFHLRNLPLPILFVLGHGALALASLLTLAMAIYS